MAFRRLVFGAFFFMALSACKTSGVSEVKSADAANSNKNFPRVLTCTAANPCQFSDESALGFCVNKVRVQGSKKKPNIRSLVVSTFEREKPQMKKTVYLAANKMDQGSLGTLPNGNLFASWEDQDTMLNYGGANTASLVLFEDFQLELKECVTR